MVGTNGDGLQLPDEKPVMNQPVAVTWPVGCRWLPTDTCDEAGRLVYYNPVVGEIAVEDAGQVLLTPDAEYEREVLGKLQRGEIQVVQNG